MADIDLHQACVRGVIAIGSLLAAFQVVAAGLERQLEERLRGAWVVIRVETYSDCSNAYTDNEVGAAGVASGGGLRFDRGEVAKVDKLNLKRTRLDLFLTLAEPVLVARTDGPFELYDERNCRVQLKVPVARELVKSRDLDGLLARAAIVVDLHPSLGAATSSELANQRLRDELPADYAETLRRHAAWKREQMNAAVVERSDAAVADAVGVVQRMRSDVDYLAGVAAGVEALRSWRETTCDALVTADLNWQRRRVPGDRDGDSDADRAWRDGYEEGQLLVFSLTLIDRLRACVTPVASDDQ